VLYFSIVALVSVLLAYLYDLTKLSSPVSAYHTNASYIRACLIILIFTLLCGTAALRIASGNDYWQYVSYFSLISQNRHVSMEFGFRQIVLLLQAIFGKDNYLAIFGAVSIATVFFFLKGIVKLSCYLWASLGIFLALGYYYFSFNSIRYYLALAIAIRIMDSTHRRRYLAAFGLGVVAACFHRSVIFAALAYLIASVKWTKLYVAAGLLLSVAALAFQKQVFALACVFYPDYAGTMSDTISFSWINIGRALFVFALFLFVRKGYGRLSAYYLKLNALALVWYVAFCFLPESSRIGYYLNVSNIFLIPELIGSIDNERLKKFLACSSAAGFVVYFFFMLRRLYDLNVRVLPYLTWIFD